MGQLLPPPPGESISEWIARTRKALDAIEKIDCGQGFSTENWLQLLSDYIEES